MNGWLMRPLTNTERAAAMKALKNATSPQLAVALSPEEIAAARRVWAELDHFARQL